MPKLIINIPEEIHSVLKELAVKERRSLTNYIICRLEDIATGRMTYLYTPYATHHETIISTNNTHKIRKEEKSNAKINN